MSILRPTADQYRAFEGALVGPPHFTVKLANYTWKVDIQLLANESGFFKKILQGAQWKESNENAIELHDDDPSIFARILQYVYYNAYLYDVNAEPERQTPAPIWSPVNGVSLSTILNGGRPSATGSGQEHTPTVNGNENDQEAHQTRNKAGIDVLVYLLADKYLMPNLKQTAIKRFCQNANTCEDIVEALSDHIEEVDEKFRKEALACCIANVYESYGKRHGKSRRVIQRWLLGDNALCVMVMDAMKAMLEMEKICQNGDGWGPSAATGGAGGRWI